MLPSASRITFVVTDRSGIENEVPAKHPYIVISIHDTYSPSAQGKQNPRLQGVLTLAFDDGVPTKDADMKDAFTLMSAYQADEIWQFVTKHRGEVEVIVVHCEAGQSRSPAVAAALCKGMGGNDRRFWRRYDPNRHVYRLLLEASRKARER